MRWTGENGWPVPYPGRLEKAIWAIPSSERLTWQEVDGFARLIVAVDDGGRQEELPRSRPASQKATDAQLEQLHDLAKALADHIDKLKRPAVAALFAEGTLVFEVQRHVRRMQEDARHAWGAEVVPDLSGPRKIVAAEVAAIAASIFEEVSGRRPTFTTDPLTSEVSGDWPQFLGLVFEALYIQASVASQVKALSQKRRLKTTA